MSDRQTAAVLAAPIAASRRTTLLALALQANRRGVVSMTLDELAASARLGMSTVRRALSDLEQGGYLSREGQRQRARHGGTTRAATRYTLSLDRLAA